MDFNKIAQDTLDFNSKAVEVHITSDGVAFLDKGSAKWHAGTLKNSKVRTFDRDGEVLLDVEAIKTEGKDSDDKKMSATDLIALINESDNLEDLEGLLPEAETRKTVLAAYDAKKTELEKGTE